MKNISLIFPFRERYWMLEAMFESLTKSTAHPNNIEILIVIDDDEPNLEHFGSLINRYLKTFDIIVFTTKRSIRFTTDYLNPLASFANGRWVIPINDDCEFLTPEWDAIIHKEMKDASRVTRDDILLGLTKDGIPRKGENEKYPHFSCFPVVPKAVIEAQGFLWDERCLIWGCDHIIADVFRMLSMTRRLVSLVHVEIDHISTHTGKRKINENYKRFQEIDQQHQVTIGDFDHSETLKRLRDACKS